MITNKYICANTFFVVYSRFKQNICKETRSYEAHTINMKIKVLPEIKYKFYVIFPSIVDTLLKPSKHTN